MSLQIWLPLNGDLTQQGLSNVIASGTLTYSDSGKIGKCANVDSGHVLTIPYSSGAAYDFSFSFWIKIPTAMNSNTSWEIMLDFKAINTANSTVVTTIPIDFAPYHQVKIYADGNHEHSWRSPIYDTWEHWSIVHHSTASSSNIKLYINGVLDGSYNTSHPLILQNGDIRIGTGISIGSFALNDFRAYNHSLSAKEVKELSKGLVLHYRLAGSGQENLVTSLSAGGQTSIDGTYSVHTSKTNADTYFYANLSSSLNPGDKVTVSCDVSGFSSNNYQWNFPFWSQGSGLAFWLKNGHCSQTFTVPSGATASNRIIFDDNGAINGFTRGDSIIYIKNFKVERGSVQTPWCPNPADALYNAMGYNDNIEYDCSGYRRNGTKKSNIVWDINSARYATSYKFDGSTTGIEVTATGLGNIMNNPCTIAFWLYSNDKGGRSIYFSSYNSNPFWCIEKAADERFRYDWNNSPDKYSAGITIPDKKWTHICFVREGVSLAKLYLNGELKYSFTDTTSSLSLGDTWRIGRDIRTGDGTPLNGNMSDFRIYATVLSAEDIQELYHSAVIVDNTGKNYAYEYFEA